MTTPTRTLLDLATLLAPGELTRAVNEAEVLRLPGCTPFKAPFSGHRRATKLKATANQNPEPQLTRSEAEQRVLALIRAARLPAPRTNVRLHGYEVDLLWPPRRDPPGQGLSRHPGHLAPSDHEPEALVATLDAALALALSA